MGIFGKQWIEVEDGVFVDPHEVACVRTVQSRAFRPETRSLTAITLRSGDEVWIEPHAADVINMLRRCMGDGTPCAQTIVNPDPDFRRY